MPLNTLRTQHQHRALAQVLLQSSANRLWWFIKRQWQRKTPSALIFWTQFYQFVFSKFGLSTKIYSFNARYWVENQPTHWDIQSLQTKNLRAIWGPFLDFVIADTLLNQKLNFTASLPPYNSHYLKFSNDLNYRSDIRKIQILSPKQESHSTVSFSLSPLMEQKKIAVYTAIFGKYDNLLPSFPSDNCDYICFTDQDFKSDTWKIIKVTPADNKILNSRLYKMLPHRYLKDYQASLYIDGNVQIKEDLKPLIDTVLAPYLFSMYPHHARNNILDEARAILQLGKAPPEIILKQMSDYSQKYNFSPSLLFEAGFIWRQHHHPDVIHFMEFWWSEFQKYPYRDQLSLWYTIQSLKMSPSPLYHMNGNAHKSRHHVRLNHGDH